jgi:hypothetical protein
MKLQSLGQVSDQTSEAIRALAVQEFLGASDVLPLIETYQIDGNADSPRKVDSSMTVGGTRALQGDFSAAATNTPGFANVSLAIYGGPVKTDAAFERRGKATLGSQRAKDLQKAAQSLGRYVTNAIFNHDGSSISGNPSMHGLAKMSLDNSRDVTFDPTGDGTLPTGNDNATRKKHQYFIEFVQAAIEDMAGAGQLVIFANGNLKARLASIGREWMTTVKATDIFGNTKNIDAFADVPIINPKYAADNSTLILPNNETVSARTGCCSLYLAILGEEQDVTFATNVGLHVIDNGKIGSQYQTTMELDIDGVCLNPKAIKRIKGFVIS